MKRKPRLVVIPPQHLGHELHVARCVVIDMLKQNFLSPSQGDSIITGLRDRRFFYESLFGNPNTHDFSSLPSVDKPVRPPTSLGEYLQVGADVISGVPSFSNYEILNLAPYAMPPTDCTFSETEQMRELGYSIPKKFFDAEFQGLARSFDLYSEDKIKQHIPDEIKYFVVIHHRYSAGDDKLLEIFASLPLKLPKLIFTANAAELGERFRGMPNALFCDDLQLYATALSDFRCKLLISEWSGGGQLGQYLLGPQGGIWFYYDHYPDIYNFTATHKIWERNALMGDFFNCWDFKNLTGCDIKHFGTFKDLNSALRLIQAN
jgi:hypothetical protein